MNGEIQQASNIVISARKALFDKKEIDFTPSKFVLSIQFFFAPKSLFCKSVRANSVYEWFNICSKRNLQDIKFFIPTNEDNKHLLGFANASKSAIVCYWNNGKISWFCPSWEFDQKNEGWKIVYSEQIIKGRPIFNNLHFTDRTDEFKQTLLDIQKFAKEIEQPYFSEIFNNAFKSLSDFENIEDDNISKQLPNDFKSIYHAVDKADVFGAMGSWNDSPSYYAHRKELDKEYNELSNQLLVQLRYHLMYITNECWKRN